MQFKEAKQKEQRPHLLQQVMLVKHQLVVTLVKLQEEQPKLQQAKPQQLEEQAKLERQVQLRHQPRVVKKNDSICNITNFKNYVSNSRVIHQYSIKIDI